MCCDAMREKIADVVRGNLPATREMDDWAGPVADAIIAALPDMVPPLVWSDYPMGSRCDTDSVYNINYWEPEKVFVDAYTTMRRHPTLEAAKAAANAHHAAQIMQALGIAQEGE